MRVRTSNTRRYDDLIGFLVAFEKRAKKMEVCCDLETDVLNSFDSTHSSVSINTTITRQEVFNKRSERGRLRTPVEQVLEHDMLNEDSENYEQRLEHNSDRMVVDAERYFYETFNDVSNNRGFKINHMIFAALEVVEVIMNTEDSHSFAAVAKGSAKRGNVGIRSLKEPDNNMDGLQKNLQNKTVISTIDVGHNEKFCGVSASDELEVVTVSSSSSMSDGSPELELYDCGDLAKKFPVLPLNDVKNAVNSQQLNKFSILRSSRFDKDTTISSEIGEENVSDHETKSNLVIFRDPIHEVIPVKNAFYRPSKHATYVVGDHVEITEGTHKYKVGCVLKVMEDLVQVEVGFGYFAAMYLSRSMIQHCNRNQYLTYR